jgi:3alpha(or 20beta)-hydroxysteroid dehydrogenase
MGRLENKVAIISGGVGGIGEANAREFVRQGAKVVIGDVRQVAGQTLAADIGPAASFAALDVTDASSWAATVRHTVSMFGPPTTLVNNAGIIRYGLLADIDLDDFMDVMRVNLIGCWLGIKAVVPHMVENGHGSIINVASAAAHRALANRGSYTPSKWAVRGLTKVSAMELGNHSIRVNCILPGYIDTPIFGERRERLQTPENWLDQPIQRIGTGWDIAQAAVFLASDESEFCTGSDIAVDGGATLGYRAPPA